ncbi:MAG: hypothetical protein ACPGYK_06340 [Flavobacteriales bacterium]
MLNTLCSSAWAFAGAVIFQGLDKELAVFAKGNAYSSQDLMAITEEETRTEIPVDNSFRALGASLSSFRR